MVPLEAADRRAAPRPRLRPGGGAARRRDRPGGGLPTSSSPGTCRESASRGRSTAASASAPPASWTTKARSSSASTSPRRSEGAALGRRRTSAASAISRDAYGPLPRLVRCRAGAQRGGVVPLLVVRRGLHAHQYQHCWYAPRADLRDAGITCSTAPPPPGETAATHRERPSARGLRGPRPESRRCRPPPRAHPIRLSRRPRLLP
jgi:hypothetical protein